MSASQESSDGSTPEAGHVRWLVAGPFSVTPTGRTMRVDRNGFAERFADAAAGLAETPDAPPLTIRKLSDLSLAGVLAADATLTELLQIAERLRKDAIPFEELEAKLEDPELVATLRALLAPEDSDAGSPHGVGSNGVGSNGAGSNGAGSGDPVEGLFAKARAPEAGSAGGALDQFVRTIQTSRAPGKAKVRRQARDVVEQHVAKRAATLLTTPVLQRFEAAWRGLRLLLDHCPAKAGIVVEVLDVSLDDLPSALSERLADPDWTETPDAVFVPFAASSIDGFETLAEKAEDALVPVVVDLQPHHLGVDDADALPHSLGAIEPGKLDAPVWMRLRQSESSRWLGAVTHDIVLRTEGVGAGARHVLGSGVWAVAAMLAASYAKVGGFGAIFGGKGVTAPGSRLLEEGRHAGLSAPTASFYPIRAQQDLARHGLIAVGSPRNRDQLVLSAAPMVRASADAVPLPAQILTGRIVRFAQWVRDQLPEGLSSEDVARTFGEAAKVFLFPGFNELARLDAKVEDETGDRSLRVSAQVHPLLAGIPFEIDFALPC